MHLLDFKPETALEDVIVDAKQGVRPIAELMALLTHSHLYISSKAEVLADGSGFTPMLLEESGNALVASFTHFPRASLHKDVAEYVLQMDARAFFRWLSPG